MSKDFREEEFTIYLGDTTENPVVILDVSIHQALPATEKQIEDFTDYLSSFAASWAATLMNDRENLET